MQQAAGITTTTTTTEIWQWQCAVCRADWKMLRQVTTSCPHGHGCRCCQGTPPPLSPATNPPLPSHHHHRRRCHHHHLHQEVSFEQALCIPFLTRLNLQEDVSFINKIKKLLLRVYDAG